MKHLVKISEAKIKKKVSSTNCIFATRGTLSPTNGNRFTSKYLGKQYFFPYFSPYRQPALYRHSIQGQNS